MTYNVNITNARKELYKLTDMVIDNDVVVNITTNHGNAVLISADKYNHYLKHYIYQKMLNTRKH